MRRNQVLALGVLAICVLALAPAQALAHEFDGSTALTQTANTTNAEFIFGAGAMRCKYMEVEYTPSNGLFATLTMKITKLEKCRFNGSEAGAGVNGCLLELSSAGVTEPGPGFFQEGSVGLKCSSALGFETSHCGFTIASQSPLSSYEWEDVRTTSPFESEVLFRLGGIKYTVTGTGCGTSAANGQFHANMVVAGVILK